MTYCIECGTQLLSESKFCQTCGTAVQSKDNLLDNTQATSGNLQLDQIPKQETGNAAKSKFLKPGIAILGFTVLLALSVIAFDIWKNAKAEKTAISIADMIALNTAQKIMSYEKINDTKAFKALMTHNGETRTFTEDDYNYYSMSARDISKNGQPTYTLNIDVSGRTVTVDIFSSDRPGFILNGPITVTSKAKWAYFGSESQFPRLIE